MSSEPQPSRLSRITGCILAGVVGVALGAVVEFSSMVEILRTYGKKGIQESMCRVAVRQGGSWMTRR